MKTKILLILSLAFLELGAIVAQPVGSNEDTETSSVPDESSMRAVLNSENINSKEDESFTEPNLIPLENNSTPNESTPNAVLNSEDLYSKDDSTTEPNSRPLENNTILNERSANEVLNSKNSNSKEDVSTTKPNSILDESTPNTVLNSEDLISKDDSTTEPNSRPLENNTIQNERSANAVLNSKNLNSKKDDSTTKTNSIPDKSSSNVVLNSKEDVLTTEATSIPLDTGGGEKDLIKSNYNSAEMTQTVSNVSLIIIVDPDITEYNLHQNDPDSHSSENKSDPPSTGINLNETTDQSVATQTTSPLSVIFGGICRLIRSVKLILPILLFTVLVHRFFFFF